MQQSVKNPINEFEKIYDRFSPMLYSIALEIAPSEKEAEEIMIITFQKLHRQKLMDTNQHSICATLIKLIIEPAKEQFKSPSIRLKLFENSPSLHSLLCESTSLENTGHQNKYG